MKLVTLSCLLLAAAQECPAVPDFCYDAHDIKKNFAQTVNFYSEPDFKGEMATASIQGLFGCSNDVPSFSIRSLTKPRYAMMVLHFGPNCTGRVLAEGENNYDMNPEEGCARSIFIKDHRYGGSC